DTAHEARVVRHAPAEDDAFQLQLFGKRAALLVEAAPDPGAAHLRVDAHLVAVEPVAVRIVARAVAVAGDLVPAMRLERFVAGQAHRGAVADQSAIEHRDEAAAREVVGLPANVAAGIGGEVFVNAPRQAGDLGDVARLGLADLETGGCHPKLLRPRWPFPLRDSGRSPRRTARSSSTAGRGRS